jgi:hypothetical protein
VWSGAHMTFLSNPLCQRGAVSLRPEQVGNAKALENAKRDEIASRQLYGTAALPVHILKQCGDDLTRANIMKQATNIKGYVADLALPGMTNSTTAPLRSRRSRRLGRCLVRPVRPNNRSRTDHARTAHTMLPSP